MNRIVDAVHTMSEGRPVIVAGDFNVVAGYRRDDDVDKMSRGEQRLLDRIRDELGLIACWQSANPDVPLGQTLRWMRNKVTPYHCDGISSLPRGATDSSAAGSSPVLHGTPSAIIIPSWPKSRTCHRLATRPGTAGQSR
jgi:hypothetical protein